MYKKVVVKVGTNVLTDDHGELDRQVISHIADQIATLKQQGVTVILVTSGAVGAGKALLHLKHVQDETTQRQVYSALGQVRLMDLYSSAFGKYGYFCAQVLASKEDFQGKEHFENMKNCFRGLLLDDIIPIVNENDVVSLQELMFTDNDEMAGLVAEMIGADALFLFTNVEGFFTGDPKHKDSVLINEVALHDHSLDQFIQKAKSSGGRGGMESKFNTAKGLASNGIVTYIANGKRENVLTDLLKGEQVGTKFLSE